LIEVRNSGGHAVEETPYGREARMSQAGEDRTVEYVQPGQSIVLAAHLGRLVNLRKPGAYTVRVSRIDPASHVRVESNEITVSVVP
jgi:hypothetical protein